MKQSKYIKMFEKSYPKVLSTSIPLSIEFYFRLSEYFWKWMVIKEIAEPGCSELRTTLCLSFPKAPSRDLNMLLRVEFGLKELPGVHSSFCPFGALDGFF